MTNAARLVLADCEIAADMLEEERDDGSWRILWVGSIALLRAVGHVLHKIDGRHPPCRGAANAAFKVWKGDALEHAIFREFVENERNNVLKAYEFNVHPSNVVTLAFTGPHGSSEVASIDGDLYRPIEDGYGSGVDARDIYREAIAWWRKELDLIDHVVRAEEEGGPQKKPS
ncbi:hypothetical protein VQ042_06070 [Aurantimonas sp. A2-1-M11]|uniref:hypothetical protein n=1 Tax=Aurantimonas sp. A2-1-M11 TaxID=3113712 RepID=UPI002F950408